MEKKIFNIQMKCMCILLNSCLREDDLAILVILSGFVMSNSTPFGAPEPIISPKLASQIEL